MSRGPVIGRGFARTRRRAWCCSAMPGTGRAGCRSWRGRWEDETRGHARPPGLSPRAMQRADSGLAVSMPGPRSTHRPASVGIGDQFSHRDTPCTPRVRANPRPITGPRTLWRILEIAAAGGVRKAPWPARRAVLDDETGGRPRRMQGRPQFERLAFLRAGSAMRRSGRRRSSRAGDLGYRSHASWRRRLELAMRAHGRGPARRRRGRRRPSPRTGVLVRVAAARRRSAGCRDGIR